MIRGLIFVLLLMPVVSAYAQPFSLGLLGGAGLTQDFQNYNVSPCWPPFQVPPTYSIVGSSIPQRWIAGGTVEARLRLHLSVEAAILYHEPRFKTGISHPVEVPFPATGAEAVDLRGRRV
jgi:hypothetical protein